MSNATEQLQEHRKQYLYVKRTNGTLMREADKILRRFITFCSPYLEDECCLPEEAVKIWNARRSNESDSTLRHRVNDVRAFAEYLQSKGIKAYVGDKIRSERSNFSPYIFTNAELAALFNAADSLPLNPTYPHRSAILSLVFKTIYACGLRISEIMHLTVDCMDFENGVLTLRQAKFGKDRLVPIHPVLLEKFIQYKNTSYFPKEPKAPFFPSTKGTAFSDNAIYDAFRTLLLAAGISHGGRGHGPRVHDLRHTFAVHCLRKWVKSGEDLTVALPYLSAYLGHNGLQSSQIYLHLTAEMFPDIVDSFEKKFDVLPDWGEFCETN